MSVLRIGRVSDLIELHRGYDEYGKRSYIIEERMPECFVVGPSKYGVGIFSTRQFKAGDYIRTASSIRIPDEPGKIVLISIDDNRNTVFELDVTIHTVRLTNPDSESHIRELYGIESMVNHSCNPNTYSINEEQIDSKLSRYSTYALRDINVGDEITCDYNTFEWDCKDKNINVCMCGASWCNGRIWGMKYVTDIDYPRRLRDTAVEELVGACESKLNEIGVNIDK
jgi:hypothetical protein